MNSIKQILTEFFPDVAACYTPATLELLTQAYREPQRAYHDTSHIVDLLQKAHQYRAEADRPDLIAHAILWHDVVFRTYDMPQPSKLTPRSDALNVEESAKLFEKTDVKLSPEDKACVAAMIRATSGHDPRLGKDHLHYNDTALFLDFDLSVLALPFEDFNKNTDKIRLEYPHLSDHEFFMGRAIFLDQYRLKEELFFHPVTVAVYDTPARENMLRQSERLRQKADVLAALPSIKKWTPPTP